MRWSVLFVVCLLPLAAAGSESDPEVSDPSGDSVSTQDNLGAAGADLLNGWYQEEGDDVLFHFSSGAMCADSTETIEYRWTTMVDGEEVAFGADLFGMGGFCSLAGSDTTITATGAATAATYSGNVATLTIPRSAFGDGSDGTVLAGTFGTSKAYVTSPEAWNDSDRAPDDGGGSDYVLGGVPDAPDRTLRHIEVDNATLHHATSASGPIDATYVLNWTAPANVTLNASFEGNGTVTLDIRDAAGALVHACECSGRFDEDLDGTAGMWQVELNYTAFQGNVSLTLSPRAVDPAEDDSEPAGTDDDDVPDGNVTEEPEDGNTTADDGEKSPGLPVLWLGLAVAMIAWGRRR